MAGRLQMGGKADPGIGLVSYTDDLLRWHGFVRKLKGLQSLPGIAVGEQEMDSCFEGFVAEAARQRTTDFAHRYASEPVPKWLAPDVFQSARGPQACRQVEG